MNRALHRFAFSLHQEVLDAGQEGTRLLRAQGDLWEVCTLLAFMESPPWSSAGLHLAAELGEELEPLASRLGHTFALEVLHDWPCPPATCWDHPDLDAFEARPPPPRRGGAARLPTTFGALLSQAAFLRGDWDEALHWAEDAVRHSPETTHQRTGLGLLYPDPRLPRPGPILALLDRRRTDFPNQAARTPTDRGTSPPAPSKPFG